MGAGLGAVVSRALPGTPLHTRGLGPLPHAAWTFLSVSAQDLESCPWERFRAGAGPAVPAHRPGAVLSRRGQPRFL